MKDKQQPKMLYSESYSLQDKWLFLFKCTP